MRGRLSGGGLRRPPWLDGNDTELRESRGTARAFWVAVMECFHSCGGDSKASSFAGPKSPGLGSQIVNVKR